MSIKTKRYIIFGSFILFNYILPLSLFKLEVSSDWLFVVFKLLSVIAIPIFMFKTYEMTSIVKYLAAIYILIEFAYLAMGLSLSYDIYQMLTGIVFVLYYPTIFFFVFVGWTLKSAYFFETKSVLPIFFLIIPFVVRRVIALMNLYNNIGYDIGFYTRTETIDDVIGFIRTREAVFLVYTLILYFIFEMLFYEKIDKPIKH